MISRISQRETHDAIPYKSALAYVLVMACVVTLWLISIPARNVSIIDWFWGAGFVIISVALYLYSQSDGIYAITLMAMPTLWALRFTAYIVWRSWGAGEDARYTKLRSWVVSDRAFLWLSLRKIFLYQGHVMIVVALPVITGLSFDAPPQLPLLLWVGAAVWLLGVLIEAVADLQLAVFRRGTRNQDRILRSGLWRYSRHPNYFGNALLWFGIWLAASAHPIVLLTLFSPILMTYLLVRVTGVATLDKKLRREKPGYAEHMARTNAFLPLPLGRAKPARPVR